MYPNRKYPLITSRFSCFMIALLAGAILPFAFAPHHLWPLSIFSPALLLMIWQSPSQEPKLAFLSGLGFGLGMFGVGVSWVFISVHRYGNTDIPMASFITLLLVLSLAFFIATQGYCLKRFFKGNNTAFLLLGFPSSWVLFEWIRSWAFTGFPWLYLGYTELHTPLSGYGPILSVYGISLVVALNAGALVALFKGNKNAKILACFLVISTWGLGTLLTQFSFTTASPTKHTVSLVQGNIAPFDKFSQEDPIGATEKTYGRLTETHWGTELILWPESAVPLSLPYSQDYINQLQIMAEAADSTLITGIQVKNAQGEYHNSLIALGNGKGIYHKFHLLPFGDFVPFQQGLRGLINFFDIPMSSFTEGPKNQELITAGKLKLDPLICYEIAFPELVRSTLRNADAIITLSEDGWFGDSWGPHQHLEIAQMRALETGRYVLRATTSGITAIINAKGQIIGRIPQFHAMVLQGTFESMQGETPWVRIGLWPLLIVLILMFILPGRFRILS